MLLRLIDVALDKAEVDDTDTVLRVLVVRLISALTDKDVVQLEVIISVAGLVNEPELFQQS